MNKGKVKVPYNTNLERGSILVRSYYEKDIQPLYEAVRESINEVSRWFSWFHPGYSIEESEKWISNRKTDWENGTDYSFCIIDAEDGTFLGGCGLNQVNNIHAFANLGYWIRTSRTGKGAATSAARLVAGFGFNQLGLKRVEIVAPIGNHASQRVAEKAGAHREGLLRNRLIVHGHPVDAVMFSLIPADLEHQLHEVTLGGMHEP